MRVAIVRSDIGHIYLNDVENSSQRNFSSQPAGQSRYFHKPSTAEFLALLNSVAFVTIQGTDTAATVDTTVSNGTIFKVKTSAAASYTSITVTSSATAAKTQLVIDLNAGFKSNNLPLVARIAGTNKITIDSTTKGPSAYIQCSTSTAAFATVVGLSTVAVTGMSVSTLTTAVYPSGTTVDVSAATVGALSTFTLMTTVAKAATIKSIADFVAPQLVESGPVLLSFALGALSKIASSSFQPGGVRAGLPAGIGCAIVANDGTTAFTL